MKKGYNNISRQIHPNTIRQILFLAILIFIGYVIFDELFFLLGAFLGAITLYVILMYPMKYLVIYRQWKAWMAALVLLLFSLVVMVIPIAYMITVVIERLEPVFQNPSIINEIVANIHSYLYTNFDLDILNSEEIKKISGQFIPFLQSTLGGTLFAFGNIFLMFIILYFLLVETRNVEIWLKRNVPFKTSNVKIIISDIRKLVYSNALGIPIVAFIQGMAGLIGYWIFGVEEFILMGILTAISSVIPIVGTMAIYLPLALYQFSVVSSWQGIGVALWGFIIIGAIDNIARFLVQKKLADIHPLITLLGVIMGVNLFGFLGIIFGPLLLSVFFILGRIYVDEFGRVDANNP